MTDPGGVSLNGIFGFGDPKAPPLKLADATKVLMDLRERIPKGVPPGYWPAVLAQIQRKVTEVLDVPISSVIGGAWRKYAPLLKYCDKGRYPADMTSVVPLANHTINTSFKPFIEIFANEQSVGTINFQVALSIILEGANLSIQDGKFKTLELARGRVNGKLSCEGAVLVDLTSRNHELPGEISFGDGFPIRIVAASYPPTAAAVSN
jgi:hypothetical protein